MSLMIVKLRENIINYIDFDVRKKEVVFFLVLNFKENYIFYRDVR